MLKAAALFFVILPMVIAYPEEVFKWKTMEYKKCPKNLNDKIGTDPYFVALNNRPTGFTVWKNIYIIAIPRRAPGVVSTLNYFEEKDFNKYERSPKISGFPDYKTNELTVKYTQHRKRIISVYETKVDKCDRLWFVDVGTLEYTTKGRTPIYIQNPSIWIIDMKTKKTIRRVDLTDKYITKNKLTGFGSITVDVNDKDCENAFAYIPVGKKIITYSFDENKHSNIKFWVAQISFSVRPNIISIALSKPTKSGSRTAYFHLEPTDGTDPNTKVEFSVSTTVLKSGKETLLTPNNVGIRDGDSNMHDIDQKCGVMFLTSFTRNAITCWDPSKPLKPSNMATLHQDDNTLNRLRDLQVDVKGFVWYLSAKWDEVLKATDYNFRVFRFNAKNEIRHNVCNPRRK